MRDHEIGSERGPAVERIVEVAGIGIVQLVVHQHVEEAVAEGAVLV
jgi:hypothetical protein